MTRVLMATHPWGVIQDKYGNGRSALTATIANEDATPATHWSAVTGGTSSTGAVTADSRGRLMRWIESGIYTLTVDGETLEVHATPGSVEGRLDDLIIGGGDLDVPDLVLARIMTGQGNGPGFLCRSGSTLFMIVGNDSLVKSYDITVPDEPVFLGQVGVGSGSAWIGKFGNNLFVTDQNTTSLRVINATNPAAMTVTTTFAYSSGGTGGGRFGISPDGTKLMVGGPESGANDNKAYLIDISTPGTPATLGSLVVGGTHRNVTALSNTTWALASRDDHTARLIDATTPSAPTNAQTITLVGEVTTDLQLDGTTLYAVGYGTGVFEAWTIDPTLVATPVFLDSVTTPLNGEQCALNITDNVAYIACRGVNKLTRVDISDPTSLVVTDELEVTGTITQGVALDSTGDYVYMSSSGDTTNGLLYVFSAVGGVSALADALQGQVESLDASKARLQGTNTLTSALTLSAAAQALRLTGAVPGILFGDDELRQLSDNTGRWDVTLTLLAVILYGSGALIRVKTAEADVEYSFQVDGVGKITWSDRTAAPDCRLERQGANNLQLVSTDLSFATAGRGIKVKEGSNAKQGASTLVAGAVVVSNTSVTATSRIILTSNTDGGTPGFCRVSARTASTSFTITSSNGADTSVVAWEMFQVAP